MYVCLNCFVFLVCLGMGPPDPRHNLEPDFITWSAAIRACDLGGSECKDFQAMAFHVRCVMGVRTEAVCMYVRLYVHTHTYMYIHIHIYYISINDYMIWYIYIDMCMSRERERGARCTTLADFSFSRFGWWGFSCSVSHCPN